MPNNNDELKPCPFCGSTKIETYNFGYQRCQTGCQECGASTEYYDDYISSQKAWNTRFTGEAKLKKVLEAVEWFKTSYWTDETAPCPCCFNIQRVGHAIDCQLQQVLAGYKEFPG